MQIKKIETTELKIPNNGQPFVLRNETGSPQTVKLKGGRKKVVVPDGERLERFWDGKKWNYFLSKIQQ